LNKALLREHYQLPTQEEITSRLAGAKYFSKLDATSGFWQMPLDEDSSYLTTFNTPFGRYRFTVVPFGVTFAQEVFHRTVHEQFRDLPGCETDIDDILIWGRTIEEHDRNLERVLNRVAEINMTLGRDKCQFRQTEITYLGETLTQTGVKPDSNKIKAILQYTRPTSKHDLQRLLGMTNFIAKFLPKLSEVTAPLRELIKKNNEFDWLETHEQAFVKLKNLIVQSETLRYYDVTKAVILQVDASQAGLGAALIQEHGPVAYASKAMNDTQCRYAQIEKELLAVVFGCKRFHQYVYGKPIVIESDHKPLEAIFKKPLSQAPSRLQKMLLQLQAYDITLVYKKGSEMYIADALSRAYPPEVIHEQFERDIESEHFVHLMSVESYVTDRKIQEIKDEISTNETMQLLVRQIQTGWPESKVLVPVQLHPYYPYRDELTTNDNLIYKAQNIIIPPNLQADTLKKLHQSHQGIEKTKRLARECIFWPGMNSQIEELVSTCPTCLHHGKANQREPLHPHEIPQRPWQKVGTDLFDWQGKPHLIVVDYYSRYPEVAELRDTKASTVIKKTKSFFSRHGIPETVISDNGPQYSSAEYQRFSSEYNFVHTTISPKYPQSGGLHERTVQTVKNILKKCRETDQDPYLALLDYRNTPIDGVTPAQALMSRRLRSSLPISQQRLQPATIDRTTFLTIRGEQQQQQKKYFNNTSKPLPPLKKGDRVRFRKDPESPWQPAVVKAQHDTPRSYIIETSNGSQYRRNRVHLRKTQEKPPDSSYVDQEHIIPERAHSQERNDHRRQEPPNPLPANIPVAQPRTSRYGRIINQNPNYKT
jgi:transposase InsO family protein